MRLAIVGVGNSMSGDDAAGIAAVSRWRQQFPETACSPEIRVEVTELPGPMLLELLEEVDAAIFVDALLSGDGAGSVHRFDENKLGDVGHEFASSHGWGIAETLRLARLLDPGRSNFRLRFVGIEARSLAPGPDLSPEVERAIPAACAAIQAEVESLL
jgi:hydrogenase maturation protease